MHTDQAFKVPQRAACLKRDMCHCDVMIMAKASGNSWVSHRVNNLACLQINKCTGVWLLIILANHVAHLTRVSLSSL